MSLYRVTGKRRYRTHPVGHIFEAVLDQAAETRAIERGDIRLLERGTPSIKRGMYLLPAGWLTDDMHSAA